MTKHIGRAIKKRLRTADWVRDQKASLLDLPELGPRLLTALIDAEILTISQFLAATDDQLWSVLKPLQGKPRDPQAAASVLQRLRTSAQDALSGAAKAATPSSK